MFLGDSNACNPHACVQKLPAARRCDALREAKIYLELRTKPQMLTFHGRLILQFQCHIYHAS